MSSGPFAILLYPHFLSFFSVFMFQASDYVGKNWPLQPFILFQPFAQIFNCSITFLWIITLYYSGVKIQKSAISS